MKKGLKILLITFVVIAVLIGGAAIWQRKNISMIYTAVTKKTEDIAKMQQDNNKNLIDEVGSYLDGELREPTTEEKENIENGKVDASEVYSNILKEHIESKLPTVPEKNTPEKEDTSKENKKTSDEIVSNAISRLYELQASYAARSEALIGQAKSAYLKLRKEDGVEKTVARTRIIGEYSSKVRAIQGSCDADVEKVIKTMEYDLKSIGADLKIVDTVRATYEKEKQLKLAHYASQYLE